MNDTDTKPSFDAALNDWLIKAQQLINNHYANTKLTPPVLTLEPGKRYVRIVRTEASGAGRSVHCFIDTTNGDVLKAAGWKAPAKGARGNIFTDKLGVTVYGGAYLR